jgi:short-subunit dehydrogenase
VRTEFHQRAGIDMSSTSEGMYVDAADVVDVALRGLERDQVLAVPGARYRGIVLVARLAPRRLVRRVTSRAGNARGRT